MRFLIIVCLSFGCASPEWTVLQRDLDGVLLSAHGDTLDGVWAVGGPIGSAGEALVLRREADGWRRVPAPFTETFWWVWVAAPDDVFMVGEQGIIAHWDGTEITRMDSGVTETLFGVWGSSRDDIWAVGGDAQGMGETDIILHYDGAAWTRVPDPAPAGVALFKVWGRTADDVWIVGLGGVSLHYDGSAWTHVDTGTTTSLFTVHGNSAGEVWAVGGAPPTVLRLEGGAWTSVTDHPEFGTVLNGVSVNEAGEVMVVGARGTKWLRGADGIWLDEFDMSPESDLHAALQLGDDALAVGGNFNAPPGAVRLGVLAYRGTSPPPLALLP